MIPLALGLLCCVPSQSASPAPGSQTALEFPYQRWEAAAGSRVGFAGESTLHDFSGEAARVTARLHADLNRLATTVGGEVSFLVKDLSTGKEDRDENMRGDLEAERFPSVVFRLDGLSGAWPASGAAQLDARGAFTIHGVERPRNFRADVERRAGGALRVRGGLKFLQTEHGIEPHSTLGLVRVHDEVSIWWDLNLQPVASPRVAAAAQDLEWFERVIVPDAAPAEEHGQGRLWTAESGALFELGPQWLLGPAHGAALPLEPRSGRALAAPPSAEAVLRETQERLAALEQRLAQMTEGQRAKAGPRMQEAVDRMRKVLAEAPAAGPARVELVGDETRILLGDAVWVRLEALAGSGTAASALAALPGLPEQVSVVLAGLRGAPRSAEVRALTTVGTRTLTLKLGAAVPATVPAWAMDPAAWASDARPAAQ